MLECTRSRNILRSVGNAARRPRKCAIGAKPGPISSERMIAASCRITHARNCRVPVARELASFSHALRQSSAPEYLLEQGMLIWVRFLRQNTGPGKLGGARPGACEIARPAKNDRSAKSAQVIRINFALLPCQCQVALLRDNDIFTSCSP